MNGLPLVSVIIPTHNRREQLRATVQTVLAQQFQDFEVIVCDDGSTDGTEAMIRSLPDSRIRWLGGPRSGGPAAPRNRGIQAARGQWYAFLDSDDQWHPQKLSAQVAVAERDDLRMCCTNAQILRNGKLSIDTYFPRSDDRLLTFRDLLRVNRVICSSMLVHRSVLRQVGGFPEGREFLAIEDYALWLACSMVDRIRYLSEPLTIYRDEPEQSLRASAVHSGEVRKRCVLREVLRRTCRIRRHRILYQMQLLAAGLFVKRS